MKLIIVPSLDRKILHALSHTEDFFFNNGKNDLAWKIEKCRQVMDDDAEINDVSYLGQIFHEEDLDIAGHSINKTYYYTSTGDLLFTGTAVKITSPVLTYTLEDEYPALKLAACIKSCKSILCNNVHVNSSKLERIAAKDGFEKQSTIDVLNFCWGFDYHHLSTLSYSSLVAIYMQVSGNTKFVTSAGAKSQSIRPHYLYSEDLKAVLDTHNEKHVTYVDLQIVDLKLDETPLASTIPELRDLNESRARFKLYLGFILGKIFSFIDKEPTEHRIHNVLRYIVEEIYDTEEYNECESSDTIGKISALIDSFDLNGYVSTANIFDTLYGSKSSLIDIALGILNTYISNPKSFIQNGMDRNTKQSMLSINEPKKPQATIKKEKALEVQPISSTEELLNTLYCEEPIEAVEAEAITKILIDRLSHSSADYIKLEDVHNTHFKYTVPYEAQYRIHLLLTEVCTLFNVSRKYKKLAITNSKATISSTPLFFIDSNKGAAMVESLVEDTSYTINFVIKDQKIMSIEFEGLCKISNAEDEGSLNAEQIADSLLSIR